MKRLLLFILSALAVWQLDAQTRYLVNTLSPVDSYMYRSYRYSGPNSGKMELTGGLDWYGGFTIGASVGPYKPGYATFRLGGQYESLMFVLGRIYDPESKENCGRGGPQI